jgi:predicted nuclease with RNAse H fold
LTHPAQPIAIGLDIGSPHRGFHAFALSGGTYADQLTSREGQDLVQWCRSELQAQVVAIDAPCRWSTDGRARPCEQEWMRTGIRCFSSPTHQNAHTPHRAGHVDWMLQGETLYPALEVSHPLVSRLPIAGTACFETFPHAITGHLRGGQAQAAQKRAQRRQRWGLRRPW